MAGARVKHVVVDSGAFIKNAPIKDIGEKVYTLREVVSEIRDKATRQRLQVLPYDICFREPSTLAIRAVTDFAKQTGDYRALSAVDLRVLALTYQLEKEHVGSDHIRQKPLKHTTWTSTNRQRQNPAEIAGFYLNKKKATSATSSRTVSECPSDSPEFMVSARLEGSHICEESELHSPTDDEPPSPTDTKAHSPSQADTSTLPPANIPGDPGDCGKDDGEELEVTQDSELSHNGSHEENVDEKSLSNLEDGMVLSEQLEQEEESDDEDDDVDDDDDDDDGWITPSNIQKVHKSMEDEGFDTTPVTVGCLTTDFAMQNVLIQMGLNVVAINGMLIKRAKSYVLRCFACFKITSDMMRQFCCHCGNSTLQRVSVTVSDDGSVQYFLSRTKPISTRGMKYSLPAPKGGKHAVNPVLVADQKLPHQRPAQKGSGTYDVFDPDYTAKTSPFAPVDTHSRSAELGIRQNKRKQKRNPNQSTKVYGRRK